MPSPVGSSSFSLPNTVTWTVGLAVQLSVAVAASPTFTRLWSGDHRMGVATVHVTAGAWQSFIVTRKEQLAGLPAASWTEQVTVVAPTGKNDPDGGLQTGAIAPVQLSVAVAL